MENHTRFAHGERLKCTKCDAEFMTQEASKNHESRYHDPSKPDNGDNQCACRWCKEMFPNLDSRRTHSRDCSKKPEFPNVKDIPFSFYEDDEEITFYLPGWAGYPREWYGSFEVAARNVAQNARDEHFGTPRILPERDYSFSLRNHSNRYRMFRNYIAERCPNTRRTTKVVSGPFTRRQVLSLENHGRFAKRKFKKDPKASEAAQARKDIKDSFNKWIKGSAPRYNKNGKRKWYHPDMIVWGHTLEHALGGSSLLSSISFHGARANLQEISAIEFFGRRLVTELDFDEVYITYGDLTRSQCWKYLVHQDRPHEPFQVATSDGLVYHIPYASYRVIFAKKGRKWHVFAFMHGQFGLKKDPSLDHRKLMKLSVEQHFDRIRRYCVNPDVISELTTEFFMTQDELANLKFLNSFNNKKKIDLCEDNVPRIDDPNPDHE
jgi:hypothetical protein